MVTLNFDALTRLRRPEYTGKNRCVPCTVVNLLLAVAVVVPVFALSVPIGFVLFAGCLLAIYLRGYLVPRTPELTKRYLPPAVLRLFGKEAPPETLGDVEGDWEALSTAGITERGEELALTDDFRERWFAAVRDARNGDLGERDVERLLGAESATKRGDRAFSVDGNQLVRWESRAAFLADVAAATVFRERFEDWNTLDRDARRDLFERLRLLLDRCPDCDGPIRRESDSVDPCCQRSYTAVWTECERCGALLAETSVPAAEDDELAPLVSRIDRPT